MTFDVAVVGGGTAGCVLAARLSEDASRSVCLIEAGPDYGSRTSGRWPPDLLDPRAFTFTHDWGTGGEDERSLGARVIGGCSVHNACMALAGTSSDYDEWGAEWSYEEIDPDVFGEELDEAEYRCADRIAAVWLAVRRPISTVRASKGE